MCCVSCVCYVYMLGDRKCDPFEWRTRNENSTLDCTKCTLLQAEPESRRRFASPIVYLCYHLSIVLDACTQSDYN